MNSGARRRQLAAVGVLAAVALAAIIGALDLLFGLGATLRPLFAVAGAVGVAAVVGVAVPAVIRRADTIVAQTVRWTSIATAVAAVYVLLIVGLVGRPRGGERWVLAAAMTASLVLAALAAPLGRRIDAFANQLAYGQTRAPGALLEEFARRLTRALPRDEQLLQLAESIRQHLLASRVEVWTGDDGVLERTVSLPRREGAQLVIDAVTLPVVVRAGVVADTWIGVWLPALAGASGVTTRLVPATHGGQLLGLVVVERAIHAEPFSVTDDRLLGELGPRLGLALQTMKLDAALQRSLEEVRHHAEELQASRARIVEAADTERRRIERDLHDGAQQRLIALGLKAAMAGKVIREDPERAAALVEELRADVKASTAELRALSHGIYPPTLEGWGLAAALSETGGRFPFRVDVDAEGLNRYTPSIEAAVFFCCLEALQNAAKHAGEDPVVRIEIREADGALHFSVTDDGPGFATTDGTGTGLVGMRDRAGAVGGSVSIESSPGAGTVVRGWIPVEQDHAP